MSTVVLTLAVGSRRTEDASALAHRSTVAGLRADRPHGELCPWSSRERQHRVEVVEHIFEELALRPRLRGGEKEFAEGAANCRIARHSGKGG
jgi:hypothetical protein